MKVWKEWLWTLALQIYSVQFSFKLWPQPTWCPTDPPKERPKPDGTTSTTRSGRCGLCCPSPTTTRSVCPTCTPWRPSAPTSGSLSSSGVSPQTSVTLFITFKLQSACVTAKPNGNEFIEKSDVTAEMLTKALTLCPLLGVLPGDRSHCSLPYEAFLQALHGFVLVTTSHGKLVYVSENVSEYLGLSMVSLQIRYWIFSLWNIALTAWLFHSGL